MNRLVEHRPRPAGIPPGVPRSARLAERPAVQRTVAPVVEAPMPDPLRRSFKPTGSRRLPLLLGLVLVAWIAAPPAAAQKDLGFGELSDVHARASLHHRVDGERVVAAIAIEIDEGWHLYHDELGKVGGNQPVGLPTKVSLAAEGVTWGRVRFPEPLRLDQPGLSSWIWGHHGRIVLFAAGRLAPGATPGEVTAEIDGLTCEDLGSCVPYAERVVSAGSGPDAVFAAAPPDLSPDAPALVADAAPPADAVDAAGAARDWDAVAFPEFRPRREPVERGLLTWLLLALVAGALLNVMPCVLPVISIKVLSFVQQAGEDRRRVLALGLAFAAGIVTVFLGLAAFAAAVGLSWGEQFQSSGFLVAMIGIVFAFALSLFGVYELGVPAGVGNLAAGPPREGLLDAFFKGMLATALATPCSGPFLGSTLTWTLSQPAAVIFAVFLALGLGMALPYVALTANPALLRWLPRPGAWMDSFKHAMGFLLLATVLWLMLSLRQDLLLFTLVFLLFVGVACWWYGRFASWSQPRSRRLLHLLLALAIAAGGARLAFVELRGGLAAGQAHGWEEFDPEAFADSLAAGEHVFIDFTADWCFNCKLNEQWVFDSEPVVAAMADKGVRRLRADISTDSPRTDMLERLMAGLGSRSIPFMALFDGSAPDAPHVRYDIVTRADMLGLVESLPAP